MNFYELLNLISIADLEKCLLENSARIELNDGKIVGVEYVLD